MFIKKIDAIRERCYNYGLEQTVYPAYQGIFNRYLQFLRELHNQDRELQFYLMETEDLGIPKKQIDAYAHFGDDNDAIFMTKGLLFSLIDIFDKTESNIGHKFWMVEFAGIFCSCHEIAHLYFGHSQLCKSNKMPMLYNQNTGLSEIAHQALEYEADIYASTYAALYFVNKLKYGIDSYDYQNEIDFFLDAIKALDGFFFISRMIEESLFPKIDFQSHPPGLFRNLKSRHIFKFELNDRYDIDYSVDTAFDYEQRAFYEYFNYNRSMTSSFDMDNFMIKYQEKIMKCYNKELRSRLALYRRVEYEF